MIEEEVIVHTNMKYRLTKEGNRSDLFDLGYWYTKVSAVVSGPVWRLYKRTLFFGWIRQSTTNHPGIVLRWKKEYFGSKKQKDCL